MRGAIVMLAAAAAGCLSPPALDAKHACRDDGDCASDRVCVAMTCVARGSGGSAGAIDAGTGGSIGGGGAGGSVGGGGAGGSVGGGSGGSVDARPDGGRADGGVPMGWTFDTAADLDVVKWSTPGGTSMWTGADGDPALPALGAMQVTGTFPSSRQQGLAGVSFGPPIDLAGATVTAHVRLVSGLGSTTNPGHAFIYVKTGGGSVFANGDIVSLAVASGWVVVTMKPSSPTYMGSTAYDPHQVVDLGVEIEAPETNPMPGTLLFDTITYTF